MIWLDTDTGRVKSLEDLPKNPKNLHPANLRVTEVSEDKWFQMAYAFVDESASLPRNILFPSIDLG
eukprot:2317407-Prymnesium_polylepis.1